MECFPQFRVIRKAFKRSENIIGLSPVHEWTRWISGVTKQLTWKPLEGDQRIVGNIKYYWWKLVFWRLYYYALALKLHFYLPRTFNDQRTFVNREKRVPWSFLYIIFCSHSYEQKGEIKNKISSTRSVICTYVHIHLYVYIYICVIMYIDCDISLTEQCLDAFSV